MLKNTKIRETIQDEMTPENSSFVYILYCGKISDYIDYG